MKKLYRLIILIILAFLIIIISLLFKDKNYTIEYEVNNILIKEEYNKNKEVYNFTIKTDVGNYNIISNTKYKKERKLIKDLELQDNCLIINEALVNTYNLCLNDGKYYINNEDTKFKENDEYENIKIDTLDNSKYLLWNYQDFIFINNNDREKIKIFDKDQYNLKLIYQYYNYLLIPNYEDNYMFNNLFLLNINNKKITSFDLRFPVYFDSYFMGDKDNLIYLYDKKEEQEYFFDLKDKEIYKTDYKTLVNNKWENISNQKLKNNIIKFTYDNIFDYYIKDNKLYLKDNYNNINILIADNIDNIIHSNYSSTYYLKDDVLYKYDLYNKNNAIFKYSEWNFNKDNMIFIFD